MTLDLINTTCNKSCMYDRHQHFDTKVVCFIIVKTMNSLYNSITDFLLCYILYNITYISQSF